MNEGAAIKGEAARHPLKPVHPATRAGLLAIARPLDPAALRWRRG